MRQQMSAEVADWFGSAAKLPLIGSEMRARPPSLDRRAIEAILPHRGRFLLLDAVSLLDAEQNLIVARYDLTRAGDVFADHFPNHPVWPGVLQIEMIGQAGILLHLHQTNTRPDPAVTLTHVLGARFVRSIGPSSSVEIVARVFDEGWIFTVIGQCLVDGEVASASAIRGLCDIRANEEEKHESQ